MLLADGEIRIVGCSCLLGKEERVISSFKLGVLSGDELEVIVGPSGFLGAAIKLNTLAGTPLRFDLECACATSKYQIVLSLSLGAKH